jgi:NADH-quinone oxidoreductase subunit A
VPVVTGIAWWGVALYVVLAGTVVATMLVVPKMLGQRHRDRSTGERYESGLPAAGGLPRRFSIEFYVVAMLFVVFDLETAFIFAWAVAAREVGWAGYIEIVVFVGLLAAALVYLWATGALDWGTSGRRRVARRQAERRGRAEGKAAKAGATRRPA